MFDLPVITEKDRKLAAKFRNYLIDDGFLMMQFSIYSRICKNNDDLLKHSTRIRMKAPKTGNIRMLSITEKQYNDMEMIYGIKSEEENISTDNLLIF